MRFKIALACSVALLSSGIAAGVVQAEVETTKSAGGIAQLEALLDDQQTNRPVAVQGRATGQTDGVVLMELVPPQSFIENLEEGDSYPQVIVAAAEVDRSGAYQIRLDDRSAMVAQSDQFLITYFDDDGAVGGVGAGRFARPEAPSKATLASDQTSEEATATTAFNAAVELDITVDAASSWVNGSSAGPHTGLQADGDGRAADSESEQINENRAQPAKFPAGVAVDNSCAWFVRKTGINAPATMVVSGTNTNGATVSPTFAHSASSTLGFSTKLGNRWAEGSGGYSVTNRSGFTKTWPESNAYGTFSFRMQVEYQEEELVCTNSNLEIDGMRKQSPVRYTGGSFDAVKWGTTQRPTNCVPVGQGESTFDRSKATKWNGGVKLSWPGAGSINVDSQSGYNNMTKIKFDFTKSGRYLCGRHDVPAGNPGYLMADWKDR